MLPIESKDCTIKYTDISEELANIHNMHSFNVRIELFWVNNNIFVISWECMPTPCTLPLKVVL